MKRWFCRLLALALAALGAAALAEGDVLLGDGDGLYVEGMFAYDGGCASTETNCISTIPATRTLRRIGLTSTSTRCPARTARGRRAAMCSPTAARCARPRF